MKCGFSFRKLPVDAVNLELESGSESGLGEGEENNCTQASLAKKKVKQFINCLINILANYNQMIASNPTNMCRFPTILIAFTLDPPLRSVVT